MNHDNGLLRSELTGMAWPGLPADPGAMLLAMLDQLEQTQWWTVADLERHQLRQLDHSLRHAFRELPFHRLRLQAAGYDPALDLTPEVFRALPLMTRGDIQAQGEALLSRNVPAEHGKTSTGETSGSTGSPVRYYGTDLTRFVWSLLTLRDHFWHRRDFSAKLASIRRYMKDEVRPSWGPPADLVSHTGPCATFDIAAEFDVQLEWLQRQAPAYFITNVSNLYGLARRSLELGLRLPGLREARSFGGTLPDDARQAIRQAWGAPVADIYTAEEVGYIALQCPEREHYHAQAESLIVEILADDGRACRPGEVGRVVLTTLHNLAMPLVRYDIGDYAEAGERCPCGRGLPVLRRIMGRQRNIVVFPDGKRGWPSFPSGKWSHIAPIRQLQLVQRAPDRIEIRVVAARALTTGEKTELVGALQGCLGHPFAMEVQELAELPRSANFKFEDFLSEIA